MNMNRILSLVVILCLVSPSYAALPATSIFEVETGGVDTNGGGFDSAKSGTDYSQQAAAQFSGTDLASIVGTTNPCIVTSATHNFVATDVGNFITISAGTNWTTGTYEITSTAVNAATLDRACGSAASISGGTWAEGGAFLTIQKALNLWILSGMTIYVKAGTYSISTGLTTPSGPSYGSATRLIGYNTTRGDILPGVLARPIVKATASIITLTMSQPGESVENFEFDGNSATGLTGVSIGAGSMYDVHVFNCRSHNFSAEGMLDNSGGVGEGFNLVEIDHNAGTTCSVTVGHIITNSWVHDNTKAGICTTGAGITIKNNLITNNTGASSDGIQTGNYSFLVYGNTVYGNGRDGFNSISYPITQEVENNLFVSNGRYGLNVPVSPSRAHPAYHHNAFYNNTSGPRNGVLAGLGDVTLSGDPFTNAAGNDFTLNNTAGAGKSVRTVGYPGNLAGSATGYIDIGVFQHIDPTCSGGGTKGCTWSQ